MMKLNSKVAAGVMAAALAWTTPVFARDIKGVDFAESATVSGQELKLKGVGLRKKIVFNVYVAGLYVTDPAKDVFEQSRQMKLVMLRDLDAEQVGDAIRDGIKKNSASQMPQLQERLDRVLKALTAVKKGESLVISFVDGKTTVAGRGTTLAEVDGKDFGDAVFKVWLGQDPVDSDLKKGLLGGK